MIKEPLAYRLRPTTLNEVYGQEHLTDEFGFIRKCIESKTIFSMIFYGNPGCGKTTLATIIANSLNLHYRFLNATTSNKKDMETVIEEAKMYGHLVVIIDEVHRLNKDKQDYLLSYIESGIITLIGATTANPYHAINPAIRSRCHILEIKPLNKDAIVKILKNALTSEKGLNNNYSCDDEVLNILASKSNGDVRFALNNLEVLSITCKNSTITIDDLKRNVRIPNYMFDKNEDGYYNTLSAFQKSIRGSDVNAALFYLARLCEAEDLVSIERRLLVTAYEDIGLANPSAVDRAFNAIETAKKVGFPEAVIPLSFAVIDLTLSPKSKSACESIYKALELYKQKPLDMPDYLHYTPVNLKDNQKYPYDKSDAWVKIAYMPYGIRKEKLYEYATSGNYEKALVDNYLKLSKIERTYNLEEINKN